MRDPLISMALLATLNGPGLPTVVLNISERFQFCVDAGAAAAIQFFDELTSIGLHDHIAESMHLFLCASPSTTDADPNRCSVPGLPQQYADAFAAGYLGRIQQQLRVFHKAGDHSAAARSMVTH